MKLYYKFILISQEPKNKGIIWKHYSFTHKPQEHGLSSGSDSISLNPFNLCVHSKEVNHIQRKKFSVCRLTISISTIESIITFFFSSSDYCFVVLFMVTYFQKLRSYILQYGFLFLVMFFFL